MPTADETITLYRKLADRHARMNRIQERDRFLLLAADAALRAGRGDQAEKLRSRILADNPNHLLRPFDSLGSAMQSPDIVAYVQQLRRNFPYDKAAQLLKALPKKGGPSTELDQEFALPLDSAARPGGDTEKTVPSLDDTPSTRTTQNIPFVAGSDAESAGVFALSPNDAPKRRSHARAPVFQPAEVYEEDEADEIQAGHWVGGLLFVVFLIASLGLFARVFVLPFFDLELPI